jgi:hypothetical protein
MIDTLAVVVAFWPFLVRCSSQGELLPVRHTAFRSLFACEVVIDSGYRFALPESPFLK